MDVRSIRLVLARELRDTLRDRRTLALMLGLPIVLYPLLMIGVTQMVVVQYTTIVDAPPPIAVTNPPEGFAEFMDSLTDKGFTFDVKEPENPEEALEAREIDAWIEYVEAASPDERPRFRIYYSSESDHSRVAETRARALLKRYREARVKENLASAGLDRRFILPFDLQPKDVASETTRGGALFGQAIAILLVLMAITFPFYPAIDSAAGEKERGTLETVLVSPIGRRELVLGKFIAIFIIAVFGSALNLGAMLMTFGHFATLVNKTSEQSWELRGHDQAEDEAAIEGMIEKRFTVDFETDASIVAMMMSLLVPLCGLFSAVSLALSSQARTYKEGQYYLTPMVALALPLVMVAMLPEIRLTWPMAIFPVANVVILFRELLGGEWYPWQFVIVLASTSIYAGMALFWTQTLFSREEILFRQPGSLSWRFWKTSPEYEGRPRPRHAVSVFIAALLLIWFVGVPLQTWNLPWGLAITLVVLVLAPPILATRLFRFRAREVFSIEVPNLRSVAGSLVLGASGFALGLQVSHWSEALIGRAPSDPSALGEIGLFAAIVLFCVLPPLCEEALCRGFILKGFLADSKPWVAILASALLFGFLHLSPHRLAFTFLLGVLLGWAVYRSGSLFCGMLLHATSNGLAIALYARYEERLDLILHTTGLPPSWLGGAVLATALGAALVGRKRNKVGQVP